MKNENQKPAPPKPITLIATIGSSPAVLTEALYELHRQGVWPVEKIVIITTEHGRQVMEERLFAWPDGGYYHWCNDAGVPPHTIHIDNRWVIPKDGKGQPLYDIRTNEDDRCFAERVQQTIRIYCQKDNHRVFGLLSGGRKTMGAHLFSAMQLFARAQDQLLHVLVSEPFDNLTEFFYPTKKSLPLKGRDGKSYDASQAEVCLVDIPFLRLRSYLSDTTLDFDQPYAALLQEVAEHLRTAGEKPVRTFSIDLSQRMLFLNGRGDHNGFLVPSRELTLITWMAIRSISEQTIASVTFDELEQPFHRWLMHLLYYMINRREAEKDKWLTDPDYRRASKIKTELKTKLDFELRRLKWDHSPRLHHLFAFTENVRNAARAEHQLLIPPENLSLFYTGDTDKLETYLKSYMGTTVSKNKVPELNIDTFKKLQQVLTLFKASS